MPAPVTPVRQLDPITALSAAVGSLLTPYFDVKKWDVPRVIGLPMSPSLLKRLADHTPRLYVGFEGFEAAAALGHAFAGPLTMRLIMVVKNPDKDKVLLGDRVGPGLYPSLMAGIAALHGRNVEGIGSIIVKSANQATVEGWYELGAAAGVITFAVHTKLKDFLGEGAAAPDFLRLTSSFEVSTANEPAFEMGGDTTLPGDTA